MTRRTACALALLLGSAVVSAAPPQEFAHVLHNGEQAILSVFGSRPVVMAASQLVNEFGVVINVEDPTQISRDDIQDIGIAASGRHVLIPRPSLLEMSLALRPDGSLLHVDQVVRDLADAANTLLPFAYRVDINDDAFTLVPTRSRDDERRPIDITPILDQHIMISRGTRRIFEHINAMTAALRQQTGIRVDCCAGVVGGVPWGSTVVTFEAHDEPARGVLLRLLRSNPGAQWHYVMRCQPGESWCFINVAAVPDNSARRS